jgi:hypothetical protein
MSKITISDINVEMLEVSEVDAAAIVGGDDVGFNTLLLGLATLGAGIASQKIASIVEMAKDSLNALGAV